MKERLSEEEFNRIVEQTLDDLPEFVSERMDEEGVMVHVCEEPASRDFPDLSEIDRGQLLGAFIGRSLADQHEVYLQEPNRIELYRQSFLRTFGSVDLIEREIRMTLVHELGHFLGMDEERVRELEEQLTGGSHNN